MADNSEKQGGVFARENKRIVKTEEGNTKDPFRK